MIRLWPCLLLLGVLAGGCSAPHDNPLDPQSDRYRPGSAPVDLSGRVYSEHISRHFPTTDIFRVTVELAGSDALGQDSVWVSVDGDSLVPLQGPPDYPVWAVGFAPSTLPFGDIRSAIGLPFVLHTVDGAGVRHEVEPAYLFRVIEGTPLIEEPDSLHVVDANPTFSWAAFDADFRPFYYRAILYKVVGQVTRTVWESGLVADTVTSLEMPDSLSVGQYHWTLAVLDVHGNYSRSKEGDFYVQTP